MADMIPDIELGLGPSNEYVVFVGDEDAEATDVAGLLSLAPGLLQPEAAARTAVAVNHIAQGSAFAVIEDPAGFAADYRRKLAAEDPSAPWQEGVVRLGDYGVPEFDEIKPPELDGSKLTFFAVDTFLGLPYRVEIDLSQPARAITDDDYKALDLTPIEDVDDEEEDEELTDEDRAFIESLATTTPD